MALPASVKVWKETMDPYDLVDFKVNLATLVAENEEIASFTVTTNGYGLTIGTGIYSPTVIAKQLTIWLSIDPAFQNDPKFLKGITIPLEVTITTDSTPPRRKQRTVAVKVIQR